MADSVSPPKDALVLIKEALNAPSGVVPESLLRNLYRAFEAQPGTLPLLLPNVLPLFDRPEPVRTWVLNYMDLAFCRGVLTMDARRTLAPLILNVVLSYIFDPNQSHVKMATQCYASAYPSLFHYFITDVSQAQRWSITSAIRERLMSLFNDPSSHTGTKIAIVKAFQRIVLVHNAGAPNTTFSQDVNVSLVPLRHPFLIPEQLDKEAHDIILQVITLLYSSDQTDLVIACMNTLAMLARHRAGLMELVVRVLCEWTPMHFSDRLEQRFVEKALRTLFRHLIRFQVGGPACVAQLQAALDAQAQREVAAESFHARAREAEAKRKRDELAEEIAMAAGVKRPRISEPASNDLEAPSAPPAPAQAISGSKPALSATEPSADQMALAFQRATSDAALANFDVTQLPLEVVVDLIIANFQAISEASLEEAVARTRANLAQSSSSTPSKSKEEEGENTGPEPVAVLEHFELAPPSALPPSQATELMKSMVVRMSNIGMDEVAARPHTEDGSVASAPIDPFLWSSLISRLAVRGLYTPLPPNAGQDEIQRRDRMLQYADQLRGMMIRMVLENPEPRLEMAGRWLLEEWTADRQRHRDGLEEKYEPLLLEILSGLAPMLTNESKWLLPFLEDLPALTSAVLNHIVSLAKNRTTVQLGLQVLREVAFARPPVRTQVASLLLSMTRSLDELLRRGAITTVRVWVTNATPPPPLQSLVLDYAHQSLGCLVKGLKTEDDDTLPPSESIEVAETTNTTSAAVPNEVSMQDLDGAAPAQSGETNDVKQDPRSQWDEADVLRYLELALALCVKVPILLHSIFDTYVQVTPTIKAAMEKHITRLIASMGPHHTVLLELLSDFPEGAQGLAFIVFQIMFDKEQSPALVQLVYNMSLQRNLDPRFVFAILPHLKKNQVLRLLPRVVGLLGDESMARDNLEVIQKVFDSIVVRPEEMLGGVRTDRGDRVTPTELMSLLHRKENEIGKKAAARAVQICLNMTEVFRAEVLAGTMNQIVEEVILPTIFLRTVLMAVDKFPTLKGYVSGNLLSRLITKKVWLDPILWTGFIKAAKKTVPGSYAALAQLPKDQMREIAVQDTDLREGLRDYFVKKTGNNPARMKGVLDLLDVSMNDSRQDQQMQQVQEAEQATGAHEGPHAPSRVEEDEPI